MLSKYKNYLNNFLKMKNKILKFKNGSAARNLRELCLSLKTMDDKTYHHHAAEDKNDFSCWVKDVLCDEKCASDLYLAKSRREAVEVIEKRLKQ